MTWVEDGARTETTAERAQRREAQHRATLVERQRARSRRRAQLIRLAVAVVVLIGALSGVLVHRHREREANNRQVACYTAAIEGTYQSGCSS
jgi:hypothetical protein